MISGFIVDPDRKKMSKSKGNAIVPDEILDEVRRRRGALARGDGAARAWTRPFDETQMKVGRRLAMKVLNASKFVLVLASAPPRSPAVDGHEPVDRAMLAAARPRSCAAPPTRSRPTTTPRALEVTEKFFWEFCDDYLELVKERAYGARGDDAGRLGQGRPGDRAARPAAAARAVPALRDRGGLVVVAGGLDPPRRPGRPRPSSASAAAADDAMLDAVAAALAGIRGAKSNAKVSMRTELARVDGHRPGRGLAAIERCPRGPAQRRQDHRRPGAGRGGATARRSSVDVELATAD